MKLLGISLLMAVVFSIFSLFSVPVFAAPISAVTNKLIYGWGDTLTVTGTINATGIQTLTATIYDSTGSTMNTSSATSSGDATNTFSITNVINNSYSPGNYILLLTDGTDTVNISFKVMSQLIILETNFIDALGGLNVINVSTDTIVTSTNQTTFVSGGNLTELVSLSLSGAVHYGNYSLEGKTYHFALVDQTNTSNYDRLYIDDDTRFNLFNDTEDGGNEADVEYQALQKSSVFSNGTFRYIVGGIERTTGNKIILFKPAVGKPPYSTSDTINFVVVARNSSRLLSNQVIGVTILNSTGSVTSTTTYTTNEFGWFNASETLSNVPAGFYVLSLNESLGVLPFPVEAFKLFVSITDQSDNPTSSFAPNSDVRIIITSKNSTSPINLTIFTASINYPSGSVVSKTISDFTQVADGIYKYDLDLTNAPTGRYGVSVSGSDGTNTQTTSIGFEIQTVNFEAMAVNTRYLDEVQSSGAEINAFPPNSNVTIMTFLSNISAGGMMAKGPEGFTGLITPENCNSSITLTEVKDENDVSYSVNYRAMNLSDALNYFGITPPEQPPQQMLAQCMIAFATPNKTGIYGAEVKINYQGEEKYSGVTFGVQRLFARGATVDFKGDDFSFLAPNSTVRIKLKIRDLVTDQELSADNITNAKIIELYKVFPSFKDVLANSTLRNSLNESIANGTISFTSPSDEGFYMMKFRFTADVGGTTETGIGDAFFMLKKYMIWGQLAGAQEGQWFVKPNQNITLTVIVMDIDKAQSVFGGYSSQKTCTGCGGFVVNTSEVRNDQQFKTVTGYTLQTGTITNSTNPVANVTIIPSVGTDMQSGWYSVDLIVNDTSTGTTYFGWGGFEIRNFWVDVQKVVKINATHFQMQQQEGSSAASYAIGQPIYFTVLPRIPNTPTILDPTDVSVESVQWFVSKPPVPVSGYTTSVSQKYVTICGGGPGCSTDSRYVVAITDLPSDKQGEFQANVKVTTAQGSDIGSFSFDVSSYQVETKYRASSWPPLFATTENLTVNFTATDFESNPRNITNVTIENLFDNKQGRPIKMMYGQNYTTNCSISANHNFCIMNVNISSLHSGEYNLRFAIVDNQSTQKASEAFFKVQGTVVSIPSIEEAWVWETESVSNKVEQNVRRGQWSQCQYLRSSIPDASFFCGDYQTFQGDVWQFANFNLTAPNVSYTKEVFGYIPLMDEWNAGRFGSVTNKSRVCMYANGSHMWINATLASPNNCNLNFTTPIAVGDTFTDSMGGLWRLDTVGDQSITITGLNTLYRTGILINTSYSKSGIIKIGQIEERNLGAFTQQGRTGLDLNDDGFTNGTAYFAIADNASAGVYDTFFFSTNGNFTGNASPSIVNPISVNDANRTNREFGFGSTANRLTLFVIDPRAQNLRFYSHQVGDWANLGEVKWNSNITIPLIVASPDGSPQSVNVSVTGYKNTRTWYLNQTSLVTDQNITGIDEVVFNSSNLVGTGEYSFAIKTDESMEEWKWPVVTVRGLLVDGETGEAFYVSNFKQLPLTTKNWENGVTRIQSDRRNMSVVVNGVMVNINEIDYNGQGCRIYNATGNATAEVFAQSPTSYGFMIDPSPDNNGYFLYNLTSGLIYKNTTCWFNTSATPSYHQGSYLMLSRNGRSYNMSVLAVDRSAYNNNTDTWSLNIPNNDTPNAFPHSNVYNVISVSNVTVGILPSSQYSWNSTHIWLTLNATYENYTGDYNITYSYNNNYWRTDFGVAGIDSSVILPMVNSPFGDPSWAVEWGYMQNVSLFGTYYDVILANHTSNYQRCILEPMPDGLCAKKAWLVPMSIGNFSSDQTKNVTIGQNFTADLYLAAVGPNDGDGITVGNFSALSSLGLSQLPAIGGIPLADSTTSYFAVLNETALVYDLDKNSSINTTFYMLTFDSDFNSQQNLTSNLIDDDLELLPWSLNVGGTEIPFDFTQNETYAYGNRTREQWCNLPTGIYTGCARFGDDYPNVNWEQQPSWDMPFYNNTHMLLRKSEWRVNSNQPVDILLKVYNFDQSSIPDANISVLQMARSLPWIGFQVLPQANYTVNTTYNVTDSYGYSLLKISPATGTWADGNYQIIASIQAPQGTETFERWFCVGSCNW
jgi:hypothetical protein